MNNRIKELAEKSYSFANEVYSNMETEPEGEFDEWFKEVVMEKFAKLIIEECGVIADEFRDEHLPTLPSHRMRETFGVE